MRADAASLTDHFHSSSKSLNLNVSSWDALIRDLVKCGNLHNALSVYGQVRKDGVGYPSVFTYVALLKACARVNNLHIGLAIHKEIVFIGEEGKNLCVGSVLVCMYAECGSLTDALQAFNGLKVRNAVSWNALIIAYTKHGYGREALTAFRKMQESGLFPNPATYVGALKACGCQGLVAEGLGIHAELGRNGFCEKYVSVGNTLVDMYAKCCLFAKAREVFERLAARTVVSWNALMSGYLEHDRDEEAILLFKHMQCQKVPADAITLICGLKACGNLGDMHLGESIHAEIERNGWIEKDFFVGNALVGMYAKCGAIYKAQEVFDDLFVQDIIAWNALISASVEYGFDEEALQYLKLMQSKDILPDSVSYVAGLRACGALEALDKGQNIHAEIERRCLLVKNHFLGSALVDMYAKCSSLVKSQEVFERLPIQNVVAWTALISGYAEQGNGEKALQCFERMQSGAVNANAFTYVGVLRACGSIGAVKRGLFMHEEIERIGLPASNVIVGSSLVDMYIKFGLIFRAKQVFDLLPEHDAIGWTSLAMAYVKNGQAEDALMMLEGMQVSETVLDEITLLCGLKACGAVGATKKVANIHLELAGKGLVERVLVGNMLVAMYGKCGAVKSAQQVFDGLPFQDTACWNSLLSGYVHNKDGQQVFEKFSKMLSIGSRPDHITFLVLLNGCALLGFVAQGQVYFEAMENLYGIIPVVGHYNCIIDIFCQAGEVKKALALAKKKDLRDVVTWRSIISACKKWGAVEGGVHAFENSLRMT